MTGITVNRWKRYGYDRAYAETADGTKLGWMDLVSGAVTIEEGADAAATTAALQSWNVQRLAGETDTRSAAQIPHPPERSEDVPQGIPVYSPDTPTFKDNPPVAPDGDWEDLADRPAGYLARERAKIEWERQKRLGTVVATLGKWVDGHSDERAWRKGAEGEEHVGRVLDRLRTKGWSILHSIPLGKDADIDHLAIGPGGVFMVNTKHHPRAKVSVTKYAINVNGSKTEHLKQARDQATRVQERLSRALGSSCKVTPCVAIYNGGLTQPEMTIASTPRDVKVVTNWNIGSVLRRLDPVLSQTEIDQIFMVARRSDTWV